MSRTSEIETQVREYWDLDSATYDGAVGHNPQSRLELAAWAASLRRLLPSPPARVLDIGAGTGFLSLLLAREGYRVTALDLAPGMLARLGDKARSRGLEIALVEANAADPPRESFDAIVERHVVWTLPEPELALEAWHQAAPAGSLVLLESIWGESAPAEEKLRARRHATCSEGSGRFRLTITNPTLPSFAPSFLSAQGRARSHWWASSSRRAGDTLEPNGFGTWTGPRERRSRLFSTASSECLPDSR